MIIKDHKLVSENSGENIKYEETPNHSGPLKIGLPDTIVLHYTAGASLESSVRWLTKPEANASAHLLVGKDGAIVQLAPLNYRTWHAGKSNWKGRTDLNSYSIGIEMDNAGVLEKRADGYYTYFGKKIPNDKVVIAKHKSRPEEMAWEAYTAEQIQTVEEICVLLKSTYPIDEFVGHEDIAPERKTDPGPAFPLNSIRDKILFGRANEEGDSLSATNDIQLAKVKANLLNIRLEPSAASGKVADPLPKGTLLKVMESKNGWSKVQVATEGWVSSSWIENL